MILCTEMVKSSSCMAAMTKDQKPVGADCTHFSMFSKTSLSQGSPSLSFVHPFSLTPITSPQVYVDAK